MPLVVGISFRRVGKVYYFDPGEIQLQEGDFVIAETARGVEFGEVVLEPREVPEEELVAPLKSIVRVATGVDLEKEAANRDKERHAMEVCERKIDEHNLPMKLLDAEYAFDGSQVTFSFSADGRVDFRELVKDVAGNLKTKVQLHQIGVRDEAKLIGGYGTCGRPLCCATFLSNFEPISMKMAKDQSLFLNPAKFSGSCGKLMCCLRYEHEHYKSAQKRLPAVGAILELEQGAKAKVIDVNVISNVITVMTEEDVELHIPAAQINLKGLCRKHGITCGMKDHNCCALSGDLDLDAPLPADHDDEEEEIVEDIDVAAIEPIVEGEISVWTGGAAVSGWRTPGEEAPSSTPAEEKIDEADKSRQGGQRSKPRPPGQQSRHPGSKNRPGQHNAKGGSVNKKNKRPRPAGEDGPDVTDNPAE